MKIRDRDSDRFTKLPKWAQREIEVLEMRNRELREELTRDDQDSNVFLDPYLGGGPNGKPLGRDAHVRFMMNPRSDQHADTKCYIDAQIERINEERTEYVRIRGSHGLIIEPHSTNVFELRLGRR